jgi:hypothetical protein
VKDLIKFQKTGIVEFAQCSNISLETEFTLAGLYDHASEPAAQMTEVTGASRFLHGMPMASDLLSIASALRINRVNTLSRDNDEGRPFPR